ncbi:hypothetical protein D9758_011344 [Tetrapyrgos nigripes]|uniref:Uncharacterized protein n=1 Tax=Tetrapyrgos nigripes TaxID=182062 RepID=A0A8H5G857_9AGAR|nr:hypothetical protein D9758_011344 [Tetrapyrgos nigripes]
MPFQPPHCTIEPSSTSLSIFVAMKFSTVLVLSAVMVFANAAAIPDAVHAPRITEPTVVTATRVYPSLIDVPPYMITVTTEVVWTQYPVPTTNAPRPY